MTDGVTFRLVTELVIISHILRSVWAWEGIYGQESDTGFHLIICGLDINYTLRNSYEQRQLDEERKEEGVRIW
jgi:hypothetical protein